MDDRREDLNAAEARAKLGAAVRDSGLIEPGGPGVALLSGGPDSAALAAGLEAAGFPAAGLHLNYGLREGSDRDEDACRRLCEGLGIELSVQRPRLPEGNLQEAAREARYLAAERLRAETGADWIATGHTRTDLAETVLYRLAASPGRRALLGLAPRRGAVVRPLLGLGRDETRRLALAAGLPFEDDPSNEDPRFARARIRSEVLPVLREIHPAAEENIAATRRQLAEESDALEALALELTGGAVAALEGATLASVHPALARLAIRALAERASGRQVALSPERAAEVVRLAGTPEGGDVDLGGGLSAVCEAGHVRVRAQQAAAASAARLPVPGGCRFGAWSLRAELRESPAPQGPEVATLDAGALAAELEVRAWREGDRMRPLGMRGTKSLQDLFTDSHVPRSLRRELPIVLSAGTVAWVPGVAVAEDFRLREGSRAVLLTAGVD
jgi:tRNA(Ile)-lysidine synthase